MTSDYYKDPYRPPGGPDGPFDNGRSVNAVHLWSGGLAAAVVAGLTGLVGVLLARVVFRVALLAPRTAGAFGDVDTIRLCAVAAVAAFAATGLIHLLLLVAVISLIVHFVRGRGAGA